MEPESPEYLFVYGTLLNQSNLPIASFLGQNSKIVSEGSFPGLLYEIGTYPGAVYIPGSKQKVHGLILQISNPTDIFKRLDTYEETGPEFEQPNEFIRKLIPVQGINAKKYHCWVYLYNHSIDKKILISSGKYYSKPI